MNDKWRCAAVAVTTLLLLLLPNLLIFEFWYLQLIYVCQHWSPSSRRRHVFIERLSRFTHQALPNNRRCTNNRDVNSNGDRLDVRHRRRTEEMLTWIDLIYFFFFLIFLSCLGVAWCGVARLISQSSHGSCSVGKWIVGAHIFSRFTIIMCIVINTF